jgi:hypothetical protein
MYKAACKGKCDDGIYDDTRPVVNIHKYFMYDRNTAANGRASELSIWKIGIHRIGYWAGLTTTRLKFHSAC